MDRRTIIAFVLIGLLTIVLFWTQQKQQPARPPQTVPSSTEAAATAGTEPVSGAAASTSVPPASPAIEAGPQPVLNDDILLPGAGLKYEMRWSNQGACLRQARLTDYRQHRGKPEGVLLLDAPATAYAVAVLDFETGTKETTSYGAAIPELLSTFLKADANLQLVERAKIKSILEEMTPDQAGIVDQTMQAKIGRLTGAKFLITGRATTVGNHLSITANVMTTETSHVVTFTAQGPADGKLDKIVQDLATKLIAFMAERGPATFTLQDPTGALPLDSRNYDLLKKSDDRLEFATTFRNGLRVTKEYIPEPGKYELGVKITLKNIGNQPLEAQYAIVAAGRLVAEAGLSTEVYGAIGRRVSPEKVDIVTEKPGSVKKQPVEAINSPREPLIWAGAGDSYFAAILRPKPKNDSTFGFIASASVGLLPQCDELVSTTGSVVLADNVVVKLLTEKRSLKPGEEISDEYTYFLGPKEQGVLAQYPDIAGLLNYGWFGFISKLLLALLHGLYHVIPNYGVGIILMTILVRLCVFPMTRKGQIAMYRMQKLQPLIKELQAKHKDDKQRQGREMMELYRKHNANPMSGCWPMLVQLPILWGLYRMLYNSIDLRQQPFVFWISDLSKPDTIAALGSIPVNILPILMTISSLVQQLTMPKPADPQQAQTQKMMMFMPVLMCVMFYGLPSGVTLYWLTSTTSGIIEQRIVKLQIKRMEARGAFAPEEEETEKGSRQQKFKRK